MPLSTDYKVPQDFDTGEHVARKVHGVVINFYNGPVADLQEELIEAYNHLAASYKKFQRVQSWFYRVGDDRDTTAMEGQRDYWLRVMRSEREETVQFMTLLLEMGAEPLPADHVLDLGVASALHTSSLRDAAVSAAGGQEAVNNFRIASCDAINEAILKTHTEAEATALEYAFMAEQRSWQQFEKGYQRMYHQFFEEEDRLARQAADARAKAARQAADAKAKAAQQAADAKAKADAEAKAYSEGPSAAAGRRRQASLQRLRPVLEELRAQRQRRCRSQSPQPRG